MRARASAVLALVLSGAAVAAPAQAEPQALAVRTLATGQDVPWDIAFLPDGSGIFTERDTKLIKKITGTTVTTLHTVADAVPGGEGGLMGIAVSPTFATDNTVYVHYTAATDNRVVKVRLGGAAEPIVTGIPKNRFHNGGGLEFGPDGLLWATTGDAGNSALAQDRNSLAGKVLRFTTTGAPARDNPFNNRVYSYGHRNPQGITWANGRAYATEFGNNRTDELNQIQSGRNYGWPTCEGPCNDTRYVNPVKSWPTSQAGPSGIAFHKGALYLAAVTGRRVWKIPVTGTELGTPQAVFTDYGRVRSAAAAPDGTLWLGTSNQDGRGRPAAEDDRILSTDG
ncbi:PQQ-dependent sugar dehydrogenase [Saccharothrix algeriensis]|uniref:Glucose/arabinose dehydrogenase n=1 Tax=Saccharothrix algeriensis TaxID=173560 RepID=A0A8T8I3H4_9PSEU|nr:PQQ-dependent sugar dehydrogenase [Saccharothrix algeriensis]MBM7811492.1 glucose/arabinose dehydrogenase [Saccharothrix algeriensis]QTR05319.1 PQQ-dependent sugar dehydrogenase [Saccharothrix algeriensis]